MFNLVGLCFVTRTYLAAIDNSKTTLIFYKEINLHDKTLKIKVQMPHPFSIKQLSRGDVAIIEYVWIYS